MKTHCYYKGERTTQANAIVNNILKRQTVFGILLNVIKLLM